jgi:hypothetical protein
MSDTELGTQGPASPVRLEGATLEVFTTPSAGVVRAAFGALEQAVGTVSADVRDVSETLEALSAALGVITRGSGISQEWGGFGLIGLPIMGAIRAVKAGASQYVKQQTGIPLNTWADFVATSSAQFTAYVGQLDTVVEVSRRQQSSAGGEAAQREAREDLETLVAAQWQTRAWKQVLGRVAQLGQVVDAILKVEVGGEAGAEEAVAAEASLGFSSALGRRIKEVQTRTLDKSGDLREWVLHPFVEIRDRVRQLPTQVDEISREVGLVEVLLDLEVAEVRAWLGEIPPAEARIVGLRVASSVLLPQLAEELGEAQRRVSDLEGFVGRLDRAHGSGEVGDRAHTILVEEYDRELAAVRARLADLEAQAAVWRREGAPVIDASVDWITLELDLLAARRLAEQSDAGGERRALLERELRRLEESKALISSL